DPDRARRGARQRDRADRRRGRAARAAGDRDRFAARARDLASDRVVAVRRGAVGPAVARGRRGPAHGDGRAGSVPSSLARDARVAVGGPPRRVIPAHSLGRSSAATSYHGDRAYMPYEVSFTKKVPLLDRDQYINDCCVGGDAVVNRFLASVRTRYTHVRTHQEDWGWFIWFRRGDVELAIDVFTDDPDRGEFRIFLTSRRRGWLRRPVVDTTDLEEIRAFVVSDLEAWGVDALAVARADVG